jgi:HD-like signal output (HDOD) protein
MLENILEKIETLPPLPQTILEIETFRKQNNQEADELVKIVEKDPLCVATLLKISNSSFFGFNSKIETVKRVINLLGINFTIYVAIKEAIDSVLKIDLYPYGIKCEDFTKITHISLRFLDLWITKKDREFKDEVLLACLLHETGKFLLSETVVNRGLLDEFKQRIDSGEEVSKVEKELLEVTTHKVTAEIFRYWNFNNNLIEIIEFVDDINSCSEKNREKCQILDIVRTLFDMKNFLSEENKQKALDKAKAYNFDIEYLNYAIQSIKN